MIDIYTKAKLLALQETARLNWKANLIHERKEAKVWKVVEESIKEILENQTIIEEETGKVIE